MLKTPQHAITESIMFLEQPRPHFLPSSRVLLKPPTTDPPTTYHLPINPLTAYPPTHRQPIMNLR